MPTALPPTALSFGILRSSSPHSSCLACWSWLSTLEHTFGRTLRRSYNCEFSQSRLDTPTRAVENFGGSAKGVNPTKDTKVHEGFFPVCIPLCTFVSFVVDAFLLARTDAVRLAPCYSPVLYSGP